MLANLVSQMGYEAILKNFYFTMMKSKKKSDMKQIEKDIYYAISLPIELSSWRTILYLSIFLIFVSILFLLISLLSFKLLTSAQEHWLNIQNK